MVIEQALITKLAATAAVIALTGQRIYYVGRVPQNVQFPYVVIQTIDDIPLHSFQGYSHFNTARIQINSFDDSYLGCKAVDAAIFNALDSLVGSLSGINIGSCLKDMSSDFPNDDNPNISGIHTDYVIQYNP
jgi:hypothetical protein